MGVVADTANGLPHGLYSLTATYRQRVFVEHLGWQFFAGYDGMEQDQFDHSRALYVVVRDEAGDVCGSARLLPTTCPYLLSEAFPQLLNGALPPSSSEVWELSRFMAIDFNANTTPMPAQFASPVAIRLLEEAMACVAARGARRLIAVSPISVERLLLCAGFHVHRAGPPMIIDGHPVFACWIEIGLTSKNMNMKKSHI